MNLPNRITILRILLVPAFVTAVAYWVDGNLYCRHLALFVFLLACLGDALDGLIARRLNQKTRLGAMLDPLADKLLLVAAYLTLSFMHVPPDAHVPVWLTILVISRDVFLVFGTLVIFVLYQKIEFETHIVGKVTTVVQMAFIIAVLSPLGEGHVQLLAYLTAVLTVISGVFYIRNGIRRLSPEMT